MTVWKNDVKLGVMQAEGLVGPLCWAVSMHEVDIWGGGGWHSVIHVNVHVVR